MKEKHNHELSEDLRGALSSVSVSDTLRQKTLGRIEKQAAKNETGRRFDIPAILAGMGGFRRVAAAVLALVLCGGVLWGSVGILAPVVLNSGEGVQGVRANLQRFSSFDALKTQLLKLRSLEGAHTLDSGRLAIGSWNSGADFTTGGQKNAAPMTEGAMQDTGKSVSKDYGKTNVQVEGVDEADIMRTDGRYLYIATQSRLVIVDTAGDVPVKLSEIVLSDGGAIHEFYLESGRLILLTTGGSVEGVARSKTGTGAVKPGSTGGAEPGFAGGTTAKEGKATPPSAGQDGVISSDAVISGDTPVAEPYPYTAVDGDKPVAEPYPGVDSIAVPPDEKAEDREPSEMPEYDPGYDIAYDCRTVQMTGVRVYDISDPAKPKQTREFSIEGSLLSSRLTNGRLYLVTNKYLNTYGISEDTDAAEVLTNYRDPAVSGKTCLVPAESIAYLSAGQTQNLLSITTLDYKTDDPADIETVFGSGYILYMNATGLYVTSGYCDPQTYESGTLIMKFDVAQKGVTYRCSAVVKGTVLNQFSMDEHKGYFRIAVTKEQTAELKTAVATEPAITISRGAQDTENRVYVLDKDLKLAGRLAGIAPGERIKSVRFSGDIGYVVTFVQTDPLFVIDLSDPTAPKVRGELKIPGFSQYLHPVGEGLLLGIGQETESEYGRVITKGIKVSLFDVSNPDDPKELNHIVIGGQGSNAMAEYDHRNFVWDAGRGLGMMTAYIAENYNSHGIQGVIIKVENNAVSLVKLLNPFEESYGSQYYYHGNGYSKLLYIGDRFFLYDGDGLHVYGRQTLKHEYALDLISGGKLEPKAYTDEKVYDEDRVDYSTGDGSASTQIVPIYD